MQGWLSGMSLLARASCGDAWTRLDGLRTPSENSRRRAGRRPAGSLRPRRESPWSKFGVACADVAAFLVELPMDREDQAGLVLVLQREAGSREDRFGRGDGAPEAGGRRRRAAAPPARGPVQPRRPQATGRRAGRGAVPARPAGV